MSKRLDILRDRAAMLSKARAFFAERNVLEVDCPLLTRQASVDAHIDLISAHFREGKRRYLHSSPEYGMKRLLTEGIGDCYQLGHVFREGELGPKHNPEFTLVEWYRIGRYFEEFIEETAHFIRLFLGDLPLELLSYREAFEIYLKINPFRAKEEDLVALLKKHQVPVYPTLFSEGKDALLNLLLATLIEPKLGEKGLTALLYYPPTQAALAKTTKNDNDLVACRFELYFKGIELANGYDELSDPKEQKERFEEANMQRLRLGKEVLPLDEAFLKALEKGLPSCCGVAVGFDRLMMLRHQKTSLKEVLSFDWLEA